MVRTLVFSLPRAGVRSLVGELRSHKPSSVGERKASAGSARKRKDRLLEEA